MFLLYEHSVATEYDRTIESKQDGNSIPGAFLCTKGIHQEIDI